MEINVSFEALQKALYPILKKTEFSEIKAALLARIFSESTLDGVNSHGINRFLPFIESVENGFVKPDQEAQRIATFGSLERWDGHLGPGIVNAHKCMNRAIELAHNHGIGGIGLRNTNHWMRGGTYGWQAAEAGCITICFTNTKPNMPPWGGKDSRTGNNPFVVAIPRREGHVVLDMALSQFSFGKINEYRLKGQKLPTNGGWDEQDELSNDPERILLKERGLPIGFWKGSALSMILDMFATILSGGDSTYRVGKSDFEHGISQVFICIDPRKFGDPDIHEKLLDEIITYSRSTDTIRPGDRIYYPGERTLETRKRNLKNGIPVDEEIWKAIVDMVEK